jgi:hypothetical protein
LAAIAATLLTSACGSEPAREPAAQRGGLSLVDVAGEVGLRFQHGAFRWGESADAAAMTGGGLCWLDYDDDGWLDLFGMSGRHGAGYRGRGSSETEKAGSPT